MRIEGGEMRKEGGEMRMEGGCHSGENMHKPRGRDGMWGWSRETSTSIGFEVIGILRHLSYVFRLHR